MKRVAAGLLLAASLATTGQAFAGPGGYYHGGGYHGGGRGNVVGALLGGAVVGALVGSVMSRGYVREAPPPVVYGPPQVVYGPPQVVYEAPPVVYAPPPDRCFDTYRRVYVACYAPQPRYRDYPPPDYYYGR